ncbi:MAG: serine/threonine protein kinase, bacterial, partial [Micromonosporaceae bacterium]|nr:serine/threonine protein kinase, bacterial [Micromonosporaceae bacterium]
PRLPRQDALKVLPAAISNDADFRNRFEREADLAATLWHPHIVGVHDRGEVDGRLWISMDYVEGSDTAELCREQGPVGMPAGDVTTIVAAVAQALDYAHEQQLLHRDVKPANILVTGATGARRRILLADFGIARQTDDINGLTATNMTVGSVNYTAPEQLMGEQLDGRADQYSLAATAYHLLTGSPPFSHTNSAVVISRHLNTAPPRVADTHPQLARLDTVLTKALSKDPAGRYDTCQEFATALTDAAAATTATAAAVPADTTTAIVERPAPHPPPIHVSLWGTRQPDNRAEEDHAATSTPPNGAPPSTGNNGKSSSRGLLWAAGAAATVIVLIVAVAALTDGDAPTTATRTTTVTASPLPTQTATITPDARDTPSHPTQTTPRPQAPPSGDLGLRTPISSPACDGQAIAILGSVTTPGLYAAGVQRLLDAHPGAFYLRTDRTCPSLRAATDEGNPIYAVFELGGRSQSEVCAGVRAAGGGAYGKWLDTTTAPGYLIPC